MEEIITKINNELAGGESPDSLLLKTITNKEPMCFFVVEYLLSKGASCYSEALYAASKHDNLNIINLMLPLTTYDNHVHAYLSACLDGNIVTRNVLYKLINSIHVCHCVYNMIRIGGANMFNRTLDIVEEIIKQGDTLERPGHLRGRLYVYVAQGCLSSNNTETLDLILPYTPMCYYDNLLYFAQNNQNMSQKTITHLINNKHKMHNPRYQQLCNVS